MKKSISVLLVLTLALSLILSACGGGKSSSEPAPAAQPDTANENPSTDDAPVDAPARTWGLAVKSLSNPYYVEVKDAMEAMLAEEYPEDTIITFDSLQDINKELSNVEDMIAQKLDGIFIACMDYEGSVAAIKKARDAGIPVIVFDSGCQDMDIIANCTVISDNVLAGELAMQALVDELGEDAKIVIYENVLSYAGRERMEGAEKVLAKYPNFEVVNRQSNTGQVDIAMNVMANFIQSNPEATGVWAFNDPSAQGCIAAIKTAGKIDSIKVVGIDGSTIGKEHIKAGEQLGSAAQFPAKIGTTSLEYMYKIVNGEPLESQDIRVPVEWINASNVDDYIK